ncbi:MAG: transcriptional regulator, partial [Sphingomonadaceae bacterium]|nr:transcriptional regulator [Sphingomonadaceae bacterium]
LLPKMRVEADAMYARLLGGIRFGELERLRGSLARMHDNLASEP